MKTRRSRARVCHSPFFCAALTAILVATVPAVATAKSLYMVPEIWGSKVRAYDIGSDGLLAYQTEYRIPWLGGGAVGLAIDSDSQTLFVAYEYTNEIQMLSATTLETGLVALAAGADDLAGIVYDHDKKQVYVIETAEPNLYCYRWDAATGKLNPVPDSPFHLKGAEGFGIALDEIEDHLYVGGWTRDVLVYSTADWSLIRTITLSRPAISVAVDPARGYLYGGGGYVENFYLTQYDLNTGTESEVQVAPDAGVMGLAVDPATGFVYVTTGRENKPGYDGEDMDDLLVYEPNLALVQTLEKVSLDPTAIVIPGKHVSYNPLRLTKVIDDPVQGHISVGTPSEIPIDGEFTYAICFEHDGYVLRDILVVDTLPRELSFVRADGNDTFGRYDLESHTYTWHNPPLSDSGTTCLRLTARVNPGITLGTVVTNRVMIDAAQTPPTTIGMDAIVTKYKPPFKPLNLSKSVVTRGTGGPTGVVYVNPGEQITYRICYDNVPNEEPVTNVQLVDKLPAEVTFIQADGGSGGYDPFFHTYTWSHASLSPGQSGSLNLTVRLDRTAGPGALITNLVSIDSDETVMASASAVVTAGGETIRLSKTIKSGAVEDPAGTGKLLVSPGTDLTYQIGISNPSTTRTVDLISVVDTLPRQTAFVSAPNDVKGYYDEKSHTYTWFYDSLKPGTEVCLDLVVHVPAQTAPGTAIVNSATLTGKDVSETITTVAAMTPPEEPPPTKVVEAHLFIKPTVLDGDLPAQPTSVMVVVYLPEGVGKEFIVNTPLVLHPGRIPAMGQTVFGTSNMGKVMAFFDPVAILAAISGHGDFIVKVTGQLIDGRSFQGEGMIRILMPAQP